MGVHVYLHILPERIDPQSWAAVYDEIVGMLRAHPLRLAGYTSKEICGETLPFYCRQIEFDRGEPASRHWHVVGDFSTKRTAESYMMQRDIGRYFGSGAEVSDILELDPEDDLGVQVFGASTAGRPFHQAMLAAALVVEDAFPGCALVAGDIDRAQALAARAWPQSVLGRDVSLPVCVDAERLWHRLSRRFSGDDLVDRFARHYVPTDDSVTAALATLVTPWQLDSWFLRQVADFEQAEQLGVLRASVELLDSGAELERLLFLLCRHADGPCFEPETVARSLGSLFIEATAEETEFLNAFRRVAGDVETVWSQLGAVLFDMELMGRHLERRFDPEEVTRAFVRVFEDEAPDLLAISRSRDAEMRAAIAQARESFPAFERSVTEGRERDPEALLTMAGPDELTDHLRALLDAFALAMRGVGAKLARELREHPEAAETILRGEDTGALRRCLVRLLGGAGPTLTEEAWEWIVAERDPHLVRVLLYCAAAAMDVKPGATIKRAVFERRWLCEHVMEAMLDDARMAAAAEPRE
jgi:hypothetical protein